MVCMSTLLSHEGQGPREDIHEVGEPVGVRGAVELADVHHVVLVFQHRRCAQKHQTLEEEEETPECVSGGGQEGFMTNQFDQVKAEHVDVFVTAACSRPLLLYTSR